jgi:ADP-ribosyl-[dinitrogen reductase] hydrolase
MTFELERDRALGAMIGLAVGDAVGTTLEFKERGEFTPITDMIGGGPFRLAVGEWTDDTSMALCLLDCLLTHEAILPDELLYMFYLWYEKGYNSHNKRCFDIGTTTRDALNQWKRTGQTIAPDLNYLSGNGGIMRLAPVPIYWWYNDTLAAENARLQSQTTHGSAECLDTADKLARIIARGIRGEDQGLNEKLKSFQENVISSSGYVIDTFVAAQWAVVTTDNFRDAILKAANLGDDADTVAAVAGQIAGSLYGLSGIPVEWVEKLAWKDRILDLTNTLFDMSLSNPLAPSA